MKAMRNSFSEGVDAFRRLTAEEAPLATVTRARVLAGLPRRRRRARRTVILGASALLIVSGALAATPWIRRWSSPKLDGGAPVTARAQVSPPPVPRPEASLAMSPVDVGSAPTAADEEELRLYGQAHAAHFAHRKPAVALRLWNAYLKAFPTGRFVPEASYNRALTLARLGRPGQAIAALRPIAAGRFGAYRCQEAEALMGALAAFLPEGSR